MKTPVQDRFARLAGELAESLSFNRSIGQIYGLLYMASEALSLGDIAKRLGMSKGNASINVRTLETWGAVRPVMVDGSRRDHYEADRDLKGVLLRRVTEGLGRRVELMERGLESVMAGAEETLDPAARRRMQEIQALARRGKKALSLLPRLAGLI